MSTRKRSPRLLTIPEFLNAHPEHTENQLRWAIRNRTYNGLAGHTYRNTVSGRGPRGRVLLVDDARYLAHFRAVVPA